MECWILRTNGTIKRIRISDKKDSFDFEDGKYFVIEKHIINKKFLHFFYKPMLIYIEGFSEPLGLNNIVKKKREVQVKNKESGKMETKEIEDDTILIDAFSIHNLADRENLSVLTDTSMTKVDMIVLFMLFICIVASVAGAM